MKRREWVKVSGALLGVGLVGLVAAKGGARPAETPKIKSGCVRKFRMKPVVLEAIQYTGTNKAEIMAFCPWVEDKWCPRPDILAIPQYRTNDRDWIHPGWWIVKHPRPQRGIIYGEFDWHAEFYVCRPDAFVANCEPIECEFSDAG